LFKGQARVRACEEERNVPEETHADKQGSVLKYVGIGCLSAVVVVLLLFIAGGIFVANNWRSWVAAPTRDVMTQVMSNADLPDEQKAAIVGQTNDFIDAFERGDITMRELGQVGEAFAQSPVVPMLAVYGFGQTYIAQSGLADDEKADADYELRRAARGISEGKILPNELNDILEPLEPDPGEQPGPQIHNGPVDFTLARPEDVDDEELRAFIDNVTTAADDAEVPDEDYRIDYAAEIQKVLEAALGRELD
jgi:hypothetical protein